MAKKNEAIQAKFKARMAEKRAELMKCATLLLLGCAVHMSTHAYVHTHTHTHTHTHNNSGNGGVTIGGVCAFFNASAHNHIPPSLLPAPTIDHNHRLP